MKNLFSKYVSTALIVALILPTTSFAQADTQKSPTYTTEQIQVAKAKTKALYFGQRTLHSLDQDNKAPLFWIIGLALSGYIGFGTFSTIKRLNTAFQQYTLTDYSLINDETRLAKYVQDFFEGKINLDHPSRPFANVNNLIKALQAQIIASRISKIDPFPKDIGIENNWAKLARIVKDLQFVNNRKYFEYFAGLRRFGYDNWIVKLSPQAKKYIENNRLLSINSSQEHLFVEKKLSTYERNLKAQGKMQRRILRGAGVLVLSYLTIELVLWMMSDENDDQETIVETLNVTLDDLDDMAQDDWESFELIADRKPDFWMAGAYIYDSIPSTNQALEQLDRDHEELLKNKL